MKKTYAILALLIPFVGSYGDVGYFFDCGMSGIFFRGGVSAVDSVGKYTELSLRGGLVPFFPFMLGVDGMVQFRYGPILINVYGIDVEPVNTYSVHSRLFGATSGISFISPISERFKLWAGIQFYTYGVFKFGDSLRANVDALKELERVGVSSFFFQGNGFMRIGFSYRFRDVTVSLDIFRAYTQAKFEKKYSDRIEWGYTRYPYLILSLSVPVKRLRE